MMKRFVILSALFVATICTLNAQTVSKDSISTLKSQKETALLSAKLNQEKIDLAKLENSLQSKIDAEQKARDKAQQSADENSKIAADLADQADDRKLAKKAKRAAKSAKKDAKSARKASSSLEGLQNDIESLRKKIADDEAKLQSLQGNQ